MKLNKAQQDFLNKSITDIKYDVSLRSNLVALAILPLAGDVMINTLDEITEYMDVNTTAVRSTIRTLLNKATPFNNINVPMRKPGIDGLFMLEETFSADTVAFMNTDEYVNDFNTLKTIIVLIVDALNADKSVAED